MSLKWCIRDVLTTPVLVARTVGTHMFPRLTEVICIRTRIFLYTGGSHESIFAADSKNASKKSPRSYVLLKTSIMTTA